MDSLTVDQQNSSCQSVTDMDSNSNDVGIVSLLFYMCRNIMVCFHEWKVYSMTKSDLLLTDWQFFNKTFLFAKALILGT